MTIVVGDVRPGKCFTARGSGAVRRVLGVRDGAVSFEVRRGKGIRTDWTGKSQLPIAEFLGEVDREVGSDYGHA